MVMADGVFPFPVSHNSQRFTPEEEKVTYEERYVDCPAEFNLATSLCLVCCHKHHLKNWRTEMPRAQSSLVRLGYWKLEENEKQLGRRRRFGLELSRRKLDYSLSISSNQLNSTLEKWILLLDFAPHHQM